MAFGVPEAQQVHVQLVPPVVLHILKSGDELYLVIGDLALVDFGSTGCTIFVPALKDLNYLAFQYFDFTCTW